MTWHAGAVGSMGPYVTCDAEGCEAWKPAFSRFGMPKAWAHKNIASPGWKRVPREEGNADHFCARHKTAKAGERREG
jgi:hypothetical protein